MATSKKSPVITRTERPAKFRTNSARELYFLRMEGLVGKPLSAFTDSVAADVPAMPGKGKLAGKPEPVKGWINFLAPADGKGWFVIS